MRRILLCLFIYLSVQFVVVYVVTALWLLFVEGLSLSQILNSISTEQFYTSSLQLTFTTIYTLILLYIYIGRGWCPHHLFRLNNISLSPHTVKTDISSSNYSVSDTAKTNVPASYLPAQKLSFFSSFGIFFFVAIAALASLLPSVALQELLPTLPDLADEQADFLFSFPWGFIVVCLFAPVLEEVVFRGIIFQTLLQKMSGVVVPVVISAAIFSVFHFNPAQMPHAFLVGIMLAFICIRTHSVIPCIFYHWVNNTAAYAITRCYPEIESMSITDIFGGSATALIASVGLSILILAASLWVFTSLTRNRIG